MSKISRMSKLLAIVQARCGSTRLPRKIFKNLSNRPLIWHVVNRLKYSKFINQTIVATTMNSEDDELVNWCIENDVLFYRGEVNDVLSRFHGAAIKFNAKDIIRVTADDPFKDPFIIDEVAEFYFHQNLDFAYNNKPATFPEGLDVEIFSIKALKLAQSLSTDNFEREHMTQFFFRNPIIFKQLNYSQENDESYFRWTIDTLNDYEMAAAVYKELFNENDIFLKNDIINLLRTRKDIYELNINEVRSEMFKTNL